MLPLQETDGWCHSIETKSGVKSSIPPPPPPAYIVSDASDFDVVVLDEGKDVLVAFTVGLDSSRRRWIQVDVCNRPLGAVTASA